jgi:hypothetical protein
MTPQNFKTGIIYMTPGIAQFKTNFWNNLFLLNCIQRHINLDFGDLDPEDIERNNEATHDGSRIFSSYITDEGGTKIWIITEADRSSTTILLPSEY